MVAGIGQRQAARQRLAHRAVHRRAQAVELRLQAGVEDADLRLEHAAAGPQRRVDADLDVNPLRLQRLERVQRGACVGVVIGADAQGQRAGAAREAAHAAQRALVQRRPLLGVDDALDGAGDDGRQLLVHAAQHLRVVDHLHRLALMPFQRGLASAGFAGLDPQPLGLGAGLGQQTVRLLTRIGHQLRGLFARLRQHRIALLVHRAAQRVELRGAVELGGAQDAVLGPQSAQAVSAAALQPDHHVGSFAKSASRRARPSSAQAWRTGT